MPVISERDLVDSIADALQYVSYFHPPDFIRALGAAWSCEESPAARDAMAEIAADNVLLGMAGQPLRHQVNAT